MSAAPAEWVRAGLNTNLPIWGISGGLQFAITPGGFSGGQGGPRGLIRIGYPTLPTNGYDLINFIAVEPVVKNQRGFSELERSKVDGKQGKLFWADNTAGAGSPTLNPGTLSTPQPGVTELSVPIQVERFDNGANIRLVLSQRSDAPDELRLNVFTNPGSARMDRCILTATMGNKARTRLLWLKDGPVSSLEIFGGYKGPDFTPHAFYPVDRFPRTGRGDALFAVTTDEHDPGGATGISRFWQYRGDRVTQYWCKRFNTWDASLHCAVNARYQYWMSSTPIPGGLAYENFELVEPFRDGQEFIFGVTRMAPAELVAGPKQLTAARELINDNDFQTGFSLSQPQPGKHVRYGVISGFDTNAAPAWRLSQWSSRLPLAPSASVVSADSILSSNAAKLVRIGRGSHLTLAANSAAEYGNAARTAKDPWVHLLVEQEFEQPAVVANLTQAILHLEARLTRSTNLHNADYSPHTHAAQFQAFFTIQNRNPRSRGHGDLLWFGVPVYDNRNRFPPAYKARDFGGTEKFIFTPGGETYTSESAHDGNWIVLHRDLLPLIREGLDLAWARGFLLGSRNLSDYAISGMNMGWELPGTFDVEMEVRGLSMKVK